MHLILGIDHSALSASAAESVCGMSWPTGTTATMICSSSPIVVAVPEAHLLMAEQVETLRQEQLAARGSAPDGDPRGTA